MAGRKRIKTELRFLEKFIRQSGNDGCWLWMAQLNNKGYGVFSFESRPCYAHRYAWFMEYGAWPERNVLHRCDTPSCVRPSHLFLGGQTENMIDCSDKGRLRRGERHPRAVLTENDVRAIRLDARTQQVIADSYRVKQMTISDIKRGKTWKHA